MPIFSLLKKITDIFNKLNIEYMLSGSMAMNFYSVSRATRDIDMVVHLQESDIEKFILSLNNFYFNKKTLIEETRNKGMFNIIDLETGFKIDIIILKTNEYSLKAFKNKKVSKLLGWEIYIISHEDLIIAKLLWIQQLESERQKGDIKMLMNNKTINTEYIHKWIDILKINTFNLI